MYLCLHLHLLFSCFFFILMELSLEELIVFLDWITITQWDQVKKKKEEEKKNKIHHMSILGTQVDIE